MSSCSTFNTFLILWAYARSNKRYFQLILGWLGCQWLLFGFFRFRTLYVPFWNLESQSISSLLQIETDWIAFVVWWRYLRLYLAKKEYHLLWEETKTRPFWKHHLKCKENHIGFIMVYERIIWNSKRNSKRHINF